MQDDSRPDLEAHDGDGAKSDLRRRIEAYIDDESADWRRWSRGKAEAMRETMPEVDAMLRETDAAMERAAESLGDASDSMRKCERLAQSLGDAFADIERKCKRVYPDYAGGTASRFCVYAILARRFNMTPQDVADCSLHELRGLLLAWLHEDEREAGAGGQAREADEGGDAQPPALTPMERRTLLTLAKLDPSDTCTADKLYDVDRAETPSPRSAKPAINQLIDLGFAEKPHGRNAGARLTTRGRRLASKIARTLPDRAP